MRNPEAIGTNMAFPLPKPPRSLVTRSRFLFLIRFIPRTKSDGRCLGNHSGGVCWLWFIQKESE